MRGRQATLTPLARGEQMMADAAQKGLGARNEAGYEVKIESQAHRARGAEHRADLNVGSMGTRRGRRGHRGMGQ